MKFSSSFLALATLLPLAYSTPTSKQSSLRILTYNIRYDSQPNSITVQETINSLPKRIPVKPSPYYGNTGERPWSERRLGVANDILRSGADIIGIQEVVKRQIDDLEELLGSDWGRIGVGREDGKEKGEYSPIFYKKSAVKIHSWDTFWLSLEPFEPTRYPGVGNWRICTAAQFSSPSLGKFTVLNSHLDHQSNEQRRTAASLMLHRAKYESIKTKRPVFMSGDFNSEPEGPNSGAYKIVTGAEDPVPINGTFTKRFSWSKKDDETAKKFVLKDLSGVAKPERRSGHFATYTGFTTPGDTRDYTRIDYLFVGSVDEKQWSVESYHVDNTLNDNGSWNSDHRPAIADIKLKK